MLFLAELLRQQLDLLIGPYPDLLHFFHFLVVLLAHSLQIQLVFGKVSTQLCQLHVCLLSDLSQRLCLDSFLFEQLLELLDFLVLGIEVCLAFGNESLVLLGCLLEFLLQNLFHEHRTYFSSKSIGVLLHEAKLVLEIFSDHRKRLLLELILLHCCLLFLLNDKLEVLIFHLDIGHLVSLTPDFGLEAGDFLSKLSFLVVGLVYQACVLKRFFVEQAQH